MGGKKTEKVSKETRIWIIQRAWLRGNGDKNRQRLANQRNTRQGRKEDKSGRPRIRVNLRCRGEVPVRRHGRCEGDICAGAPKRARARFGEIYILGEPVTGNCFSLSFSHGPPLSRNLDFTCFMRVAHPSVWFQKSIKKSQTTPERDHSFGSLSPHPPSLSSRPILTPSAYIPTHLNHLDTSTGRPSSSSAASFRSVPTATPDAHRSTLTLHAQDFPSHPFAAMAHAPLPVVSSHDSSEEEEDCPVCLEPLSFSFRLPGEKPHIVPECGHALHEVSGFPVLLFLLAHGVWVRYRMLLGPKSYLSVWWADSDVHELPFLPPAIHDGTNSLSGVRAFHSDPRSWSPPPIVISQRSTPCEYPVAWKMSRILTRSFDLLAYFICKCYQFQH